VVRGGGSRPFWPACWLWRRVGARLAVVYGNDRGYLRALGPTIIAVLEDGPLAGRSLEAEVVEGRPPKTIDVEADDGTTCRYGLAGWTQAGPSAIYSFLYLV
jgi:hypothetical protein